MAERFAAFILWAAVAACAAYWGLRVFVSPRPVPSQAQPVSSAGALRGDAARLFASPIASAAAIGGPTEPALASRFKLVGVMAPKSSDRRDGQGIALIAVDGKPPRPYRVGARLDTALVLQSVASRSADIGPVQGAPAVRLELPPPLAPTTGTLPPPPPNADPGMLSRPNLPEVMPPVQPQDASSNASPGPRRAPGVGDDPSPADPASDAGNRR